MMNILALSLSNNLLLHSIILYIHHQVKWLFDMGCSDFVQFSMSYVQFSMSGAFYFSYNGWCN